CSRNSPSIVRQFPWKPARISATGRLLGRFLLRDSLRSSCLDACAPPPSGYGPPQSGRGRASSLQERSRNAWCEAWRRSRTIASLLGGGVSAVSKSRGAAAAPTLGIALREGATAASDALPPCPLPRKRSGPWPVGHAGLTSYARQQPETKRGCADFFRNVRV